MSLILHCVPVDVVRCTRERPFLRTIFFGILEYSGVSFDDAAHICAMPVDDVRTLCKAFNESNAAKVLGLLDALDAADERLCDPGKLLSALRAGDDFGFAVDDIVSRALIAALTAHLEGDTMMVEVAGKRFASRHHRSHGHHDHDHNLHGPVSLATPP